jgi:hypothetical protein
LNLQGFLKSNYLILIEIPIIVILGFASKLYRGPGRLWLNNSLGGVFYVVFFILLFSLFVKKRNILKVSIIVLSTTSALEFLQLWKPPFLQMIRSTFIGVTFLGNTFVATDFIYYLIGAIAGFFLTYTSKRDLP